MTGRPLFPRKKPSKGRKESQVSAGVIAYLHTRRDIFWWRANTGGTKYGDAYVKFGLPGQADIQGVQCLVDWPEGHGTFRTTGRFFGIELKREKGGKVSENQEIWGVNVARHGGLYIVARSVQEVHAGLGPEQAMVSKTPFTKRTYPR